MTSEMAAQRKRFLAKLFKVYTPVSVNEGADVRAAFRDYKARSPGRQWAGRNFSRISDGIP